MTISVLPAGAAKRKSLDAIRSELTKVNAELETLVDEEIPAELAADRVINAAQPLIERARGRLSSGFRYRVPASLDDGDGIAQLYLALVEPAELRKRLVQLFKADGLPEGISDQERTQRQQKLTARRVQLQVDEENATRDVEAAGFVVERNAEPDPELLLRVWNDRAQ